MVFLAVLAINSFLLAFILTPLSRNVFRKLGCMDVPDGRRKLHAHAVPRAGGAPIMIAYLGAFGLLMISPFSGAAVVKPVSSLVLKISSAAIIVFIAGLIDDFRRLEPWQKLAMQLTASYIAFWTGVGITNIGRMTVPPWLSLPVTMLWLVGCSNSFNLIDGLDGLATGAGLFAAVTMLLGGLLHSDLRLAVATIPLAGALLGFLRYNFNPASIFLGDSGSLTIGFLLGCYGIVWNQKSTTILGITAPLMALAVPLLDTGVAIVRRFLRRQPIFTADASHIHHRLLARGLTPRRVVLLLYAASGVAATMSLLTSVTQNHLTGIIIVLFCGATWIGVQHLGYVEFGVAGQLFISGAFRQYLNGHIILRTLEKTLTDTSDLEVRWVEICEACRRFGFARVALRMNGTFRTRNLMPTSGADCWNIEIPVPDDSMLCLTGPFGLASNPTVLVPLAEILHKSFRRDGTLRKALPEGRPGLTPIRVRQGIRVRGDQHENLGVEDVPKRVNEVEVWSGSELHENVR
jgi:UDP-GlcNAc:undecaprenyl-phosphate/decaprenyl-phosphate GlcNAc-1-phosphate transferase